MMAKDILKRLDYEAKRYAVFAKSEGVPNDFADAAAEIRTLRADIRKWKSDHDSAGGMIRQQAARIAELEAALRKLSFAAQTSGGCEGEDHGLQHAIDGAFAAMKG